MNGVTDRTGRGRTPGRHDRMVSVRLPGAALDLLRTLGRDAGVSLSELMRRGVLAALAGAVGPLAERVRDETTPDDDRLAALGLLRGIGTAALRLRPHGSKPARKAAQS